MKRLAALLVVTLALMACSPQAAQHIVDSFNPNGIGIGDEATIKHGRLAGETVTVLGYESGPKVQTTAGDVPLAWLRVPSNTLYWCLGQWEWYTGPDAAGGGEWRAPHYDQWVSPAFDLRDITVQSNIGVPEDSGLFVYDTNPNDVTMTCQADAGEAGQAIMGSVQRGLVATALGLTGTVTGSTICNAMLDVAVNHAAELGTNPLQLAADGRYHLLVGGVDCNGLPPFD